MNKQLILPIYLNQKIVFDTLAILENGFSIIRSVQNASSNSDNISGNIDAKIGSSNIFALLGVSFDTKITGNKEVATNNESKINEERVHTPVSLFSSLLSSLENNNYITDIGSANDLINLKTGSFVRFKGTLQKNPFVAIIESFEKMMSMALLFDEPSQKGKGGNKSQSQNNIVLNQMKGMLDNLNHGEMVDILCKINSTIPITAVLQTYIQYFNNKAMNEIVDGEFSVLGKVVKVCLSNESNPINLLRNTGLSLAKQEFMEQLLSSFYVCDQDNQMFNIARIDTKIADNSILVIPISIYT